MDVAGSEHGIDPDDFHIDYICKGKTFRMPAVPFSRYYKIYYQISGMRNGFIEDRAYHIRAGDLALIHLEDLHKPDSIVSTSFDWVLLSFTPGFLKGWDRDISDTDLFICFKQKIRLLRLDIHQQAYVESLFIHIAWEMENRQPGYLTSIRLNLMALLLFTARCAGRSTTGSDGPNSSANMKVTLAAQYICKNYAHKISLPSIAQMNRMSYFYFCRVFRQFTGYTLTEYINAVRVKRAEQLLRETRMSITAIASAVGFESSTNFGRVFKSLTRMSPLRYRMTQGNPADPQSAP